MRAQIIHLARIRQKAFLSIGLKTSVDAMSGLLSTPKSAADIGETHTANRLQETRRCSAVVHAKHHTGVDAAVAAQINRFFTSNERLKSPEGFS